MVLVIHSDFETPGACVVADQLLMSRDAWLRAPSHACHGAPLARLDARAPSRLSLALILPLALPLTLCPPWTAEQEVPSVTAPSSFLLRSCWSSLRTPWLAPLLQRSSLVIAAAVAPPSTVLAVATAARPARASDQQAAGPRDASCRHPWARLAFAVSRAPPLTVGAPSPGRELTDNGHPLLLCT
jgi:hypothetical protein